ncbi:hypothetical protein ABL78_7169 [Leptomonas seymouri]|uniref:Arrestin C-terminal-like domain-containing protein n=1 Tax=Leptomonas seymouri TaxID=5684 RepID=A0A0N0P3K9_LEPSE|nr:hypothetical protein ABL78_7169 [Leptomonas seymouri]|eukprot:KPI83787.1 hypothetical protein ABL78_7169 [Leptomonas seymouri]
MSITASAVVQCDVRLTHQHFYPGDAVEGAVVIDARAAFDVCNIHIKIVGKEGVYAMVDQVTESKTKDAQFGVSSQDYVYYREVVTLAGALVTQREAKKDRRSGPDRRPSHEADELEGGAANSGGSGAGPITHEDGLWATHGGEDTGSIRYNESVCVHPGVAHPSWSFAVSRTAAEEGVPVWFPAGHYVYPFRFLLPTSLPPNYDTGVCVKDDQFSNSRAALHYYVKLYVWSPSRVQLASARADFLVGAMQPSYGSSFAAGSASMSNINGNNECNTSSNAVPPSYGDTRAKLHTMSASGRTVRCVFPIMGTCSCMATDATLKVRFTIAAESFQIGRDAIAVSCAIASNTSKRTIRGLKISLVQVLKFETSDALVVLRKKVLETEVVKPVEPGKAGSIAGSTEVLDSRQDVMPTMKTSGLAVSYAVRVELLASHVDRAYYEFEGIVFTGAMLAGAVPPVGTMRFTALPRGRLTRCEAYYAIPTNPSEEPLIATLTAPLSLHSSLEVSQRATQLNSLAPTPKQI